MSLRRLAVIALILTLPMLAREVGSFNKTLSVSGPVDLEVQTGSGSITVRAGDVKQVQIHGSIRSSDWFAGDVDRRAREIEANPPIRQDGNSIRVDRIENPSMWNGISISYEVVVPAATKLRARTGSGGQTVDGIQGPVDVETGSGGIHVSRIEKDVRARTGSGGIELDRVSGTVDAKTGSGGIRGYNVRSALTAHTGSGGVRLRLVPNTGFDLHARTGSGRVSVDPPVTMQGSFSRHNIHGKIRGGGAPLELATGSGGVQIE